jgi:hypothetical protein
MFQTVQDTLGVSVTPSHFYFPVPELRSFRSKNWAACRPCAALDFRFAEQIHRLQSELLPFRSEWTFPEAPTGNTYEFHFHNGFFEHIDAEIAWSLVRQSRPRRIIEIGSGNTTLLLHAALDRNAAEGFPGELLSIDPHPSPALREAPPGLTDLISRPVQQIPLSLFGTLRRNDVLFIDSSHVVSIDSDVLYECLQILPRLAPGVLVHFHDIFTPLDYPEKFVMTNLCFWGEEYLLEAFLSFNAAFRVIWASSAMQNLHADLLREAFPAWQDSYTRMPEELRVFAPTLDGRNVWPCSFWITRD